MPPRVREADPDQNQHGREFTKEERMFCVNLKMRGEKYPEIQRKFLLEFGRVAPSVRGVFSMARKLKTDCTLTDLRKGRSGHRVTVRTPANIARVQRECERAKTREPGVPGPSARRHAAPVKKSTFNTITKKDLNLRPYVVSRVHKVGETQTERRLKMGRFLASKSLGWFDDLIVSDEAWFTLSGHVFNRKNTVCYSADGAGRPEQWQSEAAQSSEKVMVFALLHGSGKKFGPFFIPEDEAINQHSYRRLLETTVFPIIMAVLGVAAWGRAWWQQDGAPAHHARMVLNWLDTIFGERMLALDSRRGEDYSPSSPDMNPCDFYLWPRMKSLTYAPPPKPPMRNLKRKITRVFNWIPEDEVKRAVRAMKGRARLMVQAEGRQIENRREE